MYTAEMEPGTEYPLVLFLPGAGQRGNDNHAQLKVGVLKFAEEEYRSKHPAIVIAPQAPENEYWANPVWRDEGSALLEEPTRPLAAVYELLNAYLEEQPIDRSEERRVGKECRS